MTVTPAVLRQRERKALRKMEAQSKADRAANNKAIMKKLRREENEAKHAEHMAKGPSSAFLYVTGKKEDRYPNSATAMMSAFLMTIPFWKRRKRK